MSPRNYKKQVHLLLSVLPVVAKENCFALHGGTAINLFLNNMPRLSVDIDLTYLPVENRDTSMDNINKALNRIYQQIEAFLPGTNVFHLLKEAKLIVSDREVSIKVEVNTIKRGCYTLPVSRTLCENAQRQFEAFCEIQMVDNAHLFGGKICAALDRQHPRDLFDMNKMFTNLPFDDELKKGFIFYLVSSNRPIVEMLFPHLQDQHLVFEKQFMGMTYETFTYADFENTRELLIQKIQTVLNTEDKKFLLSIENGTPDWEVYDFSIFPAVQWKLVNVKRFKTQNPARHKRLLSELETKFA